MAAPGKGGGRRKVYYTATCLQQRHGLKGQKSTSSTWFINTAQPSSNKPSKHQGCPYCRVEKALEKSS